MSSAEFITGLEAALGVRALGAPRAIGGGCISEAAVVETSEGRVFVKHGALSSRPMFEAEADGLGALTQSGTVRVPHVLAIGEVATQAFIALEYVELRQATADCDTQLGEQLAALHRVSSPTFGWHRDNTLGLTPQLNPACEDWIEFWQQHRLGHQLRLAEATGAAASLLHAGERLLARVPALLAGHTPSPALVHGDLWSGNRAADPAGAPVIFDPAVYYGDREVELAMMRLFGGFHGDCYRAYARSWPLPDGHEQRCDLYQLYHVLNHFNLFGGGYQQQALRLVERLLKY